MPNENSVSRKAVRFVLRYEKKQDRTVEDVQSNKNYKGFDVLSISKNKKDIRHIEVKGTTRGGIPDCFQTEFTEFKKLVATHMYVVNYENMQKPVLFIIPASAFKPEHLKTVLHYKISHSFKTKILPKYRI